MQTIQVDSIDFIEVGETVILWPQPDSEVSQKTIGWRGNMSINYQQISADLLTAWADLIDVISQLRLPASGWPDDLPLIAENMMPYVMEEATEVWQILETEIFTKTAIPEPQLEIHPVADLALKMQKTGNLLLIKDLIPWLLWYVGRTSSDIMRLLQGINATLIKSEKASHGMLRLVALLEINLSTSLAEIAPISIDLFTQQPLQNYQEINSDQLIYVNEIDFCQGEVSAQFILDKIDQKVQEAAPEMANFWQDLPVEILIIGKGWHSSHIKLKLALDFQSESELELGKIESIYPSPISHYPLPISEASFDLNGELRLLNTALPKISRTNLVKESINNFANYWEKKVGNEETFSKTKLLSEIVDSASEIANVIKANIYVSEGIFVSKLTNKLLFDLIHAHYEIANLIGGFSVRTIEPGGMWENGLIKLAPFFDIEVAGQKYFIDMRTNIKNAEPTEQVLLSGSALVYAPENHLFNQPIAVQDILDIIVDVVSDVNQELKTWLEGVNINYRWPIFANGIFSYVQWQNGSAKINLCLEFYRV